MKVSELIAELSKHPQGAVVKIEHRHQAICDCAYAGQRCYCSPEETIITTDTVDFERHGGFVLIRGETE